MNDYFKQTNVFGASYESPSEWNSRVNGSYLNFTPAVPSVPAVHAVPKFEPPKFEPPKFEPPKFGTVIPESGRHNGFCENITGNRVQEGVKIIHGKGYTRAIPADGPFAYVYNHSTKAWNTINK